MVWLGIDMGGTATRWAASDSAGAVLARGKVAGASAVPDAALRDGYCAVLREIAMAAPAPVFGVVLGLTGAGLTPEAELIAHTAQALGLGPAKLTLMNDMELAWHAAYPQGGGHLIAAGTGSVGLSIDADGAVTLVGGRGLLIDDAGSGAWIALRALDAFWRIVDQHGHPQGAEILAKHLSEAVGGDDWDATRRAVYSGDRGAIAALARPVAAAAHAGDPTALALMTCAGQELARLAQVLLARCGPAPVGVIGGALDLHPAIFTALQAALPDVTVHRMTIDAAKHAAMLARKFHPQEAP